MCKKSILAISVVLLLGLAGTGFSQQILVDANTRAVEEAANSELRKYVENEIIVKFRGNAADAIETGLAKGGQVSELKLSDTLHELSKRYRLIKAKPLFKNFKRNRQRLNALLSRDKTLLSKEEKHILRRMKRAPKSAEVPDLSRIYHLQLDLEPGQLLEEVVAAYNSDPDVEYAELNYVVSINLTPNDPLYSIQWPLNNTGQMYPESGYYNQPPGTPDGDIDAPEAWDICTGSSEVVVAVVDTGVDYSHRDLDDNMWTNEAELNGTNGVDDDLNGYVDDIYGYDFYNGDADPNDDYGHGTHCAGIIAAEGDNALDIAGLSWKAGIMALKFLGAEGGGDVADAVRAFYYAVVNGADVVSNSWGGPSSITMKEAVDYAYSQGVIMVAAAGNDSLNWPRYPAYYEHVIAVAATNSNDEKASFSNYGDWVDIAAPGVDILSLRAAGTSGGTIYDDYTTIASGTSMACPHVSGACAILLSIDPGISVDEATNLLQDTSEPIATGICQSGRLNVCNAIMAMQGLRLNRDSYSCSDEVQIYLFDSNLAGQGSYGASLATSAGDMETVVLTEDTPAAGLFSGTILTSSGDPNTEDGLLQLSHGQIITATYDGTDDTVPATDTAVADCQAPIILSIQVGTGAVSARITFDTDELSVAQVRYGPACGGPYTTVRDDSGPAMEHTIKIPNLQSESTYYSVVDVSDSVGNETTDDNNLNCYLMVTRTPLVFLVPGKHPTIQEAIDYAFDGDTVIVAPGTYTGDGNRDIDFRGKAITLRSKKGPASCIIDCEGDVNDPHRGFYFHSGEDADLVLDGFTIMNAHALHGGAILCEDSSPTLINCILRANMGGYAGGGIYCFRSSPALINCVISKNRALEGAGMYNSYGSNAILENCTFKENRLTHRVRSGGGMTNFDSSPIVIGCSFIGNFGGGAGGGMANIRSNPTVTNCIFSGNSAPVLWMCGGGGGGMYNVASSPIVTNCLFTGNVAAGGGMSNEASSPTVTNCTFTSNGWYAIVNRRPCSCAANSWYAITNGCDDRDPKLTNCVLWDNDHEIYNMFGATITVTFSNVQGGWPGEGNMDDDPYFAEPGYWADANDPNIIVEPNDPNAVWVKGDYRLGAGSPCIDAGDNNSLPADIVDLDGDGNTTEPIPFDLDCELRFVDDPCTSDTGNGAPPIVDMGAFEFVLPDPVELLLGLGENVIELNLQDGIANSLTAKLDAALKLLEDADENNDVAAVNWLGAFINAVEAQRGKKIAEADADALIAGAQGIIAVLGRM